MNRAIKINDYLNRGIIEANLSFAKENRTFFSLVKFSYKMDEEDAFTFKDLIAFIHIQTDFSPILYLENDAFALFLKDTRIYQAKALINRLNYHIGNRFDFEIKDIGITTNDNNDTYKTLMDRVDKYFVMSKLSSSKKIFYGTVDFDYYDNMDPLKAFKSIFRKSNKISLNNIYSGLPISENAKIEGFSEGIMQVSIKTDKLSFYKKERFTFLQHDLIPDIIKADIIKIDPSKQLVILGNLTILSDSPVARSDIRIIPTHKIYSILTIGNRKIAEGQIASMSESSISISSSANQITEILNKDIFHKELLIKFQLKNSKNISSPIKIRAFIFGIVDNNIIVTISPTATEKTALRAYIANQQNQVLLKLKQELKGSS